VAICLMVAVLLAQARSSIQETPNSGVDKKAIIADAFLTTVREFHFIMITKEEIVAVQLHAFQNSKNSRHESWLRFRTAIPFNIAQS